MCNTLMASHKSCELGSTVVYICSIIPSPWQKYLSFSEHRIPQDWSSCIEVSSCRFGDVDLSLRTFKGDHPFPGPGTNFGRPHGPKHHAEVRRHVLQASFERANILWGFLSHWESPSHHGLQYYSMVWIKFHRIPALHLEFNMHKPWIHQHKS